MATTDRDSSLVSSVDVSVLLVRDTATDTCRPALADEVLQAAERLLRLAVHERDLLDAPGTVRDFLRVSLGLLEHEVFSILLLDAQNRLIEYVELFRGTLTQTSVYPREVVREALLKNAAGVILVHNHPSGLSEPSRADELLTQALANALMLIDVRVLDHLVVTPKQVTSFAERGLL
jgi:DNA repair protein RadC